MEKCRLRGQALPVTKGSLSQEAAQFERMSTGELKRTSKNGDICKKEIHRGSLLYSKVTIQPDDSGPIHYC